MVKIVWTDRSLKDLEDIGEYISKDSYHYARLTLEKIINSTSIIEKNPRIGRKIPELNTGSIREIILGNYRIIYEIYNKRQVNILTIHHSARLLSDLNFK